MAPLAPPGYAYAAGRLFVWPLLVTWHGLGVLVPNFLMSVLVSGLGYIENFSLIKLRTS